MQILFLILAILVFVCGAGTDIYPFLYLTLIIFIYFLSKYLSNRGPVLICGCSILFTILLGEITCRIVLDAKLYYRSHDKYFEISPIFKERLRYVPNVDSNRWIVGDLAALSGSSIKDPRIEKFVTDSKGFRNDDLVGSKPIDILVLGDSYGSGADTSQESTWASLLKEKSALNLYNLSLPGTPADELHILQTELPNLNLSPSALLIWMLFTGNDLDETSLPQALDQLDQKYNLDFFSSMVTQLKNFQNRSAISKLLKALSKREVNSVDQRSISHLGDLLFYKPYVEISKMSAEELKSLPSWSTFNETFRKVGQTARRNNLKLLTVIAPSKEDIYLYPQNRKSSSPFAELLKNLCEESSDDCLDLTSSIISKVYESGDDKPKLLWWRDDTHWNEEGHKIVAELIYQRIKTAKASLHQ